MNIRCENHAVDDWESMLMQQIGVQPVGLSPRKKKTGCLCTFVLSSIQHVVFQAWSKTA